MRAFENRNNGRSNTSCGYCREAGHSIGDCPHIKYDHDEWSAYRVPYKGGGCKSNRWFLNDYTYWMKQVNKYYPKWVSAQERKKNKGKPKAQRTTVPKKCGFCREAGHNRKDCSQMQTFTENLKVANTNFRQSFYDTIVKDLGLGIGAVVKIRQRVGYTSDYKEVIGIIDGFDLSALNIFSLCGQLDSDYRGFSEITVTVGNQRLRLDLTTRSGQNYYGRVPRKDKQGREIVSTNHYYGAVEYIETVARSTEPLDETWVCTEAMANEFEWVTKKRNKDWFLQREVVALVKRWV